MKKLFLFLMISIFFIGSCDSPIKNKDIKQTEAGEINVDTLAPLQNTLYTKKNIVYTGKDITPIISQINAEKLKGISCDGFYEENLTEQVDDFINKLYTKKINYEDYSIEKRFLGKESEIVDISSYNDAVFIYFGPKDKSYETHIIGMNKKTDTAYYSFTREDKKLTISRAPLITEYPETLIDSRILVLKKDVCYILGIHGMHRGELVAIENTTKLDNEIKKILEKSKKSGGLNEVYILDNTPENKKLKIKAVYEYLIDNITYKEGRYCRSVYGAIIEKKAVCAGYAVAFNYLLGKLGFSQDEYKYIVAGNHAWNNVKIGQKWYHIDATWGDIDKDHFKGADVKDARYCNFLKSDDYMKANGHTILSNDCPNKEYDNKEFYNRLVWKNWKDSF